MGTGSNTLDFVRQFFKRHDYQRAPYVPVVSAMGQAGSTYFAQGMSAGSLQGVTDYLRLDADLVSRYIDVEDQDDSPLISSALDIYSDDSCQQDITRNKAVWVESKDEDIRQELDNLLHKTLNIEEEIWSIIRTLCKYGNSFAELVGKAGEGVIAMNPLPPPTVRRIEIPKEIGMSAHQREDLKTDTLGFIYDPRGLFQMSTNDFIGTMQSRAYGETEVTISNSKTNPMNADLVVFESWEVVHMRLRGKNPGGVYGHGVGDAARWIFKRLVLLEDSIIMHRLTRSPSRYAFYVDVTGIPPNETTSYLNKVKQGLKKQKFVNPQNSKMDLKFDVMGSMDDFFLPSRDGKDTTRVENLQGPIYDHIEDIKFFENKIFAALKVPKPFLTYEETTAKTHLSAEDSRFARTILRVQSQVRVGLKKVCSVHLALKGINPDAVEFEICMTVPSAIFELAQLEIKNAELELAGKMKEWAPDYWIKQNILGWSDEMILEMERYKLADDAGESPIQSSNDGTIEKMLSKRPTGKMSVSSESPTPETGNNPTPETASRKYTRDVVLSSVQKNTKQLLERFEDMKQRDKTVDKRWDKVASLLHEIQLGQDARR